MDDLYKAIQQKIDFSTKKGDKEYIPLAPSEEQFKINPVDLQATIPGTNLSGEGIEGNIPRNQRGDFTGIDLTHNPNIFKP